MIDARYQDYEGTPMHPLEALAFVGLCSLGVFFDGQAKARAESLDALADQAISISVGEDSTWTSEEKTTFLRELGIEVESFPNGKNVYLKAQKGSPNLDVFASYDQNARQTKLGETTSESLKRFIDKYSPREKSD